MFTRGSRGKARLARLLPGLVLFVFCFAYGAPSEGELRATVIVAIMRFTSWAETIPDDGQLNVCLVGQPISEVSLLAADLQQKVASRALHARRVVRRDIESCQVLVMGGDLNEPEYEQLLAAADAKSVLTVCDGCRRGLGEDAIIQLKLRQQRVSFEVNLARAKSSGVALDAQLLELAAVVRK